MGQLDDRSAATAQYRLIEKMRDRNQFLTELIGCASITADKERDWWRKRRLKRLTSDLAAVANEYSAYIRDTERTMREQSSAATTESRELTDYEKGYLDGLLRGTRPGGPGRTWTEKYEKAATGFLAERGKKGWKVNAKRI